MMNTNPLNGELSTNNGDEVYFYEKTMFNFIVINNKFDTWQINDTFNSTTATNITNYGTCNPILFQLGDFSRDGPNLLYGICPDTWLTSAVSITFLLTYVIVLIVSGIGLYLKRNSPHIKARNITYMFMTILSNSGFIILTCLRFIIGRRIYPCSIYILSYFIVPPGILLPNVFRLWRLFFMHKLNLQKTRLDSNRNKESEKKQPMKILSNSNSNTNSPRNVVSPQQVESVSNQDSNDVISSDGDNYSYWIENEAETKQNLKIQKIFHLLLSHKFVLATYLTSFILHILLFIFFGAIEEGLYNSTTNNSNSNQRIFMGEGGFFVSSRGCVISNAITIIVAVEALFYIVVEIVFLVLCFIIPRDTWFIKRETLLLTCLQFFSIIVFAICGFLVQVTKLSDFFVPFGYSLMIYSFAEVVVCVLMPIIYSKVFSSRRDNHNESELEQFLRNKRTFNILLDFARRSYCPESVLCYQDIERFKMTSKKNRKPAALHIAKTYLKPNSPLELNFPKLSQMHEQISKSIETTPLLETNFFDTIQWHCIEDMTDVFERLKSQSKETRNILKQWKAATINELSSHVLHQNVSTVISTNQEELKDIKFDNSSLQRLEVKSNIDQQIENNQEVKNSQIDNLDYL